MQEQITTVENSSHEWTIFGVGVLSLIFMSGVNWINFAMLSNWEWLRNMSELARGITKYKMSVQGLPQNADLSLIVAYFFISLWKIGITYLVLYLTLMLSIQGMLYHF